MSQTVVFGVAVIQVVLCCSLLLLSGSSGAHGSVEEEGEEFHQDHVDE